MSWLDCAAPRLRAIGAFRCTIPHVAHVLARFSNVEDCVAVGACPLPAPVLLGQRTPLGRGASLLLLRPRASLPPVVEDCAAVGACSQNQRSDIPKFLTFARIAG